MNDDNPLSTWHRIVETGNVSLLDGLLAADAVFHSPAVHAPQEGKQLVIMYLRAALAVLGPTLRYVHEWHDDSSAVLEFEASLDGLHVHGIDRFRWNSRGEVTDFAVMVRPIRGLEQLISRMRAQLTGP